MSRATVNVQTDELSQQEIDDLADYVLSLQPAAGNVATARVIDKSGRDLTD